MQTEILAGRINAVIDALGFVAGFALVALACIFAFFAFGFVLSLTCEAFKRLEAIDIFARWRR